MEEGTGVPMFDDKMFDVEHALGMYAPASL
jgi:hypothetical protein